ncbi:protoporphyrinogen/coproporphyrinogen oxidase [Subtercola sp. YIM 133946]|uniref:protoporphyrinogen/coproporphyrinogen oxidase n=1 Tax=Subtercola sp. YIM 133946 TaxID=3118909 RepID=UPI002F93B088
MQKKSVVVVGAGIGGLVAARQLARDGFAVTVLEAGDTAGGCVATHTVAGIHLDSGAESFATRGGTVAAFLAELGLGQSVVSPDARGAWLQLPNAAAPLPKNTLLGIPGVPLATDVRVILGWRGAIRAQLDRVLPFVRVRKEADLGDLVRRRMGRAVLDRLVAPVVSGVHSAHPDLVDVHAVAPGLTTAMTNQGSLSGAVMSIIARRGQAPDGRTPAGDEASGATTSGENTNGLARNGDGDAPGGRPAPGSAVGGVDGGMYRLVEALVADCERLGVNLQFGVGVESVRRVASETPGSAEWMTVLADETVLGSHGVVVAAGFRAALALLRTVADSGPAPTVDEKLSGAASLESDLARQTRAESWPGSSVVTLATLVLDAPELDAAPRGTGVLVAEDVTAVPAKALTHATVKWPWLARDAGPGRHVVRLSYGRGGQTPPAITLEQALRDAALLLDTELTQGQVRGFALTDWRDSLAFATTGHRARVDALVEAVHGHPGLEVCGAWVSGTGLAYVIDGAGVKARALAQQLASA